jgi:hypothetical protein
MTSCKCGVTALRTSDAAGNFPHSAAFFANKAATHMRVAACELERSNHSDGVFLDSAHQRFRPVLLAIGSDLFRISLEVAEVEHVIASRRTKIPAHPILHEILLVPSGIQPLLASYASHFEPHLSRGRQYKCGQQSYGDDKDTTSHGNSPLSDHYLI